MGFIVWFSPIPAKAQLGPSLSTPQFPSSRVPPPPLCGPLPLHFASHGAALLLRPLASSARRGAASLLRPLASLIGAAALIWPSQPAARRPPPTQPSCQVAKSAYCTPRHRAGQPPASARRCTGGGQGGNGEGEEEQELALGVGGSGASHGRGCGQVSVGRRASASAPTTSGFGRGSRGVARSGIGKKKWYCFMNFSVLESLLY